MIFSHTIKGQKNNIYLLKEFIRKHVTLIDYEKIRDQRGKRLVYFGRHAGICGMVDSIHYYGRKLKNRGISTPFLKMKQSWKYEDMEDVRKNIEKVREEIHAKGFPGRVKPFIIGVIGRGNVSSGVQEVLGIMGAEEVHPRDMNKFVKSRKLDSKKIYMIVFYREEKIRAKSGKKFYFEEYLEHPELFQSNMDKYLSKLNMLVNCAYWDEHYPRMVTKQMLKNLYRKRNLRLEFISDISCDIGGSIEPTYRTTTQKSPVYTYDLSSDTYIKGYRSPGITIFAIDNLPTELPKDSSKSFSSMIREYIYQVAEHGALDVTEHIAIPREIRQAVVTQNGELTDNYKYLERYFA
jgi:alpha-aminoadipic semialdehyde synthase